MMRPRHEPAALVLLPLLHACAPAASLPPDGSLHVEMIVGGAVPHATVILSHPRDARHRCLLPSRAEGGASAYVVQFGPDFLPVEGQLAPAWAPYGPQRHFALEVFPAEPQPAAGPVRLGGQVRLTLSPGEGVWQRMVRPGEADAAAPFRLRLAPDLLSGELRAAALRPMLPHGRAPETEVMTVTARWRCPAPG